MSEDVSVPGPSRPRGLPAFGIMTAGQVISIFGSQLSGFAVGVWVYETTGSASLFAFISFAAIFPVVALSPLAGALVDRWDRRWSMLASDSMGAVATVVLVLLLWLGELEVWHVFFVAALGSTASAFQKPAFTASISLMVPKRHLDRANGVVQAGLSAALILGPLVAGALLEQLGLMRVVMLDLLSYLLGVLCLLVIHVPRPEPSEEDEEGEENEDEEDGRERSLRRDVIAALRYLARRRGLLALMVLAVGLNFSFGMVNVLLTPLVLSFASAAELGVVLATVGTGMLAGSVLMSLWRGPQRRMRVILGALFSQGLILAISVTRPSLPLLLVGAFGFMCLNPIVLACSQALWQSKIAPGMQGRVFALRGMLANLALAASYLSAGPLADYVFRPLLRSDGALAPTVGSVLGVGSGRGIALLFVLTGLFMSALVVVGWTYRPLRDLEDEIPDALPDEEV